MELDNTNQSLKKEDKNIKPLLKDIFIDHLKVSYEAVPEIRTSNTPDYLVNNNIFVEIKELHDGVDVKRSAQWGIITNKLQKLLTEKFKEEDLKGLYSVETPRVFKLVGDNKYAKVVSDIVDGIKNGVNEVESHGIHFKVEKINDKYNEIYLSSSSGAGSINPAGVIFQNVNKKLETANKQLGYIYGVHKIKRKIVLLVNKYIFADRISEVVEGLSYCYDDLLKYKNIDEIWLQQETRDGKFFHTKVYDRVFLDEFEKSRIDPGSKENQTQFQLWYWALEKMENKKPQLWDALEKFLNKYKFDEIFDDPFKRQEMTRLGLWLLEQGKDSDAIGLVGKLINDPDPVEPPEVYSGDPTFNYHVQIEQDKDPSIITSVMGHLAWTVQSLARKSAEGQPDNLTRAFEFAQKVLTERKNLYTIQQWLIPLVEIANRRLLILKKNPELYKSFKKLLIGNSEGRQNSLVAQYGKYQATSKLLAHVFSYFKDLTTEETKFVLDNTKKADDDYGALLIYFAIYRPNHYKKDDPIGEKFGNIEPEIWDYDNAYAKRLLKDLISENKEGHQMQTVAWNFWKIIKDDPNQFEILEEWIDMLFALPINFSVNPYLEFILEDNIDKHPVECEKWLETFLAGVNEYISEKGISEYIVRDCVHIPKTIKWLEENKRNKFEKIIKKLQDKGALR